MDDRGCSVNSWTQKVSIQSGIVAGEGREKNKGEKVKGKKGEKAIDLLTDVPDLWGLGRTAEARLESRRNTSLHCSPLHIGRVPRGDPGRGG